MMRQNILKISSGLLVCLLLINLSGCFCEKMSTTLPDDSRVPANSDDIKYIGRFDTSSADSYRFWFPGTKIEIGFIGKELIALLDDEKGENFFNIIVDGNEESLQTIRVAKGENKITLFKSMEIEKHTFEIFKLTEFSQGHTDFKGFHLPMGGQFFRIPNKKYLIEYYGDSITCGLGSVDLTRKDNGALHNRNHYVTYAAVAARELDADHICISRSGIGFSISWYNLIMPELYNRLNPTDPDSRWNFNKARPDLIVVNLGQNDSSVSRIPQHSEYKRRFGDIAITERLLVDRYKEFISQIISVYPGKPIICVLGSMDATREGSPWPGYVQKACDELRNKNAGLEIYTHFFKYKETPAHPVVSEHKTMADSLVEFVESKGGLRKI
jgi:hypothetical protein